MPPVVIGDLPKSRKEAIKHCLNGLAPDDVPHNIRIVGWKWVVDSINDGGLADQLKAELYVQHIALSKMFGEVMCADHALGTWQG